MAYAGMSLWRRRLSLAGSDLKRDLPGTLGFSLLTVVAALLSFYLAMALNLDHELWAPFTVMIVSLPKLNQAAMRYIYRLFGTVVGGIMGVVLIALFAQRPLALDVSMAVWAAACGFAGTSQRQQQTYAFALAWITTAIIVADAVVSPGGVLVVALDRVLENFLGIACVAGVAIFFQGHRASQSPIFLPPMPPLRRGEALWNALRAGSAVLVAGLFWYVSKWQSGPYFVLVAGSAPLLFATLPAKLLAAFGMIRGFSLGILLGIPVHFLLLTQSGGFVEAALMLAPFFFLGAIGVSDMRTMGMATGYNIAFLLSVYPSNLMSYDLEQTLNMSLAILLGATVTLSSFLVFKPFRSAVMPAGAKP